MNENVLTKIYELILQRLQQPFTVDSAVLHFVESTLGIDPQELAEHISDENGIIDLVIVPDIHFRKIIEPYIPMSGVNGEDIATIAGSIEKAIHYISITIEGKSINCSNSSYCSAFIHKLYLDKKNIAISPQEELFNKYIAARIAIRLFAKNHDLHMFQKIADALVEESEELLIYDSIKLFTSIVYDETDIYTALSIYKQRLQKQLWDMYEFNRLMESYSMEFLMSVRKTFPVVDPIKEQYHIRLIDAICIALFGMPAKSFVPEIEIDNDNYRDLLNTI
ncbi:MAG: hypothetical protein AB1444_04450 [Spirochaetota bacterium]